MDSQTVSDTTSNARVNSSHTKIEDGVKAIFSVIRQANQSEDSLEGRLSENPAIDIDVADGVNTKNFDSPEVFLDAGNTKDDKASEETEARCLEMGKSALCIPEDKSHSRNSHASDSSGELSSKDGKKKVARRVVSESSMQVLNKVSSYCITNYRMCLKISPCMVHLAENCQQKERPEIFCCYFSQPKLDPDTMLGCWLPWCSGSIPQVNI